MLRVPFFSSVCKTDAFIREEVGVRLDSSGTHHTEADMISSAKPSERHKPLNNAQICVHGVIYLRPFQYTKYIGECYERKIIKEIGSSQLMSISVVNLPSQTEYVNLITLSGLDEDESLILRNNTSTSAFVIQSGSKPSDDAIGYPILTGETLLIHTTFTPIWIKGGTGPFIVQELTSTITPFTGVDLPESVYSSTTEALRRVKVSSEPSVAAGVLHGLTYAISGSFSVAAGDFIAMNINPASDILIHKIVTNQGLVFDVYNQHATGTADGIFTAKNLNLVSEDISPAQGQLYTPATSVGDIIFSGISEDNPYIIASFLKTPAVLVKNTTGGIATIKITVIFEEIGQREASFGLTASTLLLSNTEMSDFG